MSIHIYKNKSATDLLFTITDELYSSLAVPIEILKKKTGIFIDEYGNTRLTHQHALLLIQLIKNEITKPGKSVLDFIDFLEKTVNDKTDLQLIGD
ncbi:hypothetical protein A3860_36375 [Niastella vici]|uniref:Uncharacterized protein n=1 Tax=Niastella vici TaxID=1703345 RepID=A0A1V9FN52_9BACT|nr:hypothetical protein [Niastella vici]OQP59758.1 hypothetical protein A3860_36375 [Niastella vici]